MAIENSCPVRSCHTVLPHDIGLKEGRTRVVDRSTSSIGWSFALAIVGACVCTSEEARDRARAGAEPKVKQVLWWLVHRSLREGRQVVHVLPAFLQEHPLQRPLPLHRCHRNSIRAYTDPGGSYLLAESIRRNESASKIDPPRINLTSGFDPSPRKRSDLGTSVASDKRVFLFATKR